MPQGVDWLRRLVVAACLGAALAGCQRQPAAIAQQLLSLRGPIAELNGADEAAESPDAAAAELGFDMVRSELHFVLRAGSSPDLAAIRRALKSASDAGRDIEVRYGSADGYLDARDRRPTFLVRALVVDGRELRGMSAAACRDDYAVRNSVAVPLERAVVQGAAQYYGGNHAAARAALDAVPADAGSDRAARALVHALRGAAREALVVDAGDGATLADDRERLAALQDYRAWAELEPGNARPRYAQAGMLAALGGYDEALATYAAIRREWLDEEYWTALRTGAVYRARGELEQALAALDGLATAGGPPASMPYHYHRGWTLTRLGRYAEAAGEFTTGLQSQPDYAWATLRRACAEAMQGDVAAALLDQERGFAQLRASAGPKPGGYERAALARAGEVAALLRAALTDAPAVPRAAPCEGYPGDPATPRARSPLLPAVARP